MCVFLTTEPSLQPTVFVYVSQVYALKLLLWDCINGKILHLINLSVWYLRECCGPWTGFLQMAFLQSAGQHRNCDNSRKERMQNCPSTLQLHSKPKDWVTVLAHYGCKQYPHITPVKRHRHPFTTGNTLSFAVLEEIVQLAEISLQSVFYLLSLCCLGDLTVCMLHVCSYACRLMVMLVSSSVALCLVLSLRFTNMADP